MNKLDYLKHLENIGVSFFISVPHECGGTSEIISASVLEQYEKDPDQIHAHVRGVSKAEYIAWQSSECNVICYGQTAKSEPCKNLVNGGYQVSAQKWVNMKGSLCHIHTEQLNK